MLVDFSFWRGSYAWPRNPKGYLFLANAVNLGGQRKYGNQWHGKEWDAGEWFFAAAANVEENVRMLRFLEKRSLNIASIKRLGLDEGTGIMFLTDEALAKLIEKHGIESEDYKNADEINDKLTKEHLRFMDIVQLISAAVADGDLRFAVRATSGGALRLSDQSGIWHTENLRPIFKNCQITHAWGVDEFDGRDSYSECYIYVDENQFDKIFPSTLSDPPTFSDAPHLSPYLLAMLSVASSMKISPSNQPKKLAVEAEIQRAWKGSRRLSPNLISAMATLLREPDSQLGRAKKKIDR